MKVSFGFGSLLGVATRFIIPHRRSGCNLPARPVRGFPLLESPYIAPNRGRGLRLRKNFSRSRPRMEGGEEVRNTHHDVSRDAMKFGMSMCLTVPSPMSILSMGNRSFLPGISDTNRMQALFVRYNYPLGKTGGCRVGADGREIQAGARIIAHPPPSRRNRSERNEASVPAIRRKTPRKGRFHRLHWDGRSSFGEGCEVCRPVPPSPRLAGRVRRSR